MLSAISLEVSSGGPMIRSRLLVTSSSLHIAVSVKGTIAGATESSDFGIEGSGLLGPGIVQSGTQDGIPALSWWEIPSTCSRMVGVAVVDMCHVASRKYTETVVVPEE
jgi:hypothetical protein